MLPRSDLLHMKNIHRIEENTVNGSFSAIDGVKAEVKRDIKHALWMEHCRWSYCTLHMYNISTRRLINILCLHTRSQEAWVHKHPELRVDWQFKWTNNGRGVICPLCAHHFCPSSAECGCRRCLGLRGAPGTHCGPRVPGIYKKKVIESCKICVPKFLWHIILLLCIKDECYFADDLMIQIPFVILMNKQWVVLLTI